MTEDEYAPFGAEVELEARRTRRYPDGSYRGDTEGDDYWRDYWRGRALQAEGEARDLRRGNATLREALKVMARDV